MGWKQAPPYSQIAVLFYQSLQHFLSLVYFKFFNSFIAFAVFS